MASKTGNAKNNFIVGTDQADVLRGFGGNDTLRGLEGNDRQYGGAGIDKIYGGAGTDRQFGDSGNDRLYGESGNDRQDGGGGDDDLYGGTGIDLQYGGLGSDLFYGGSGGDTMYGGAGQDFFYGGAGADTFAYLRLSESLFGDTTTDAIGDFTPGIDHLDFTRLDANANLGGNQNFTFIGTAAFSNKAGELRQAAFTFEEEQLTVVEADVNGDGTADFAVALGGALTLSRDDILG